MNSIINFVLRNKFAVWLLTIIVTVAGLYSGLNMKLETIPNITTPVITVTTVYPGATPEEVADKVSEPIEQVIQNLNGVNVVSSNSFQNASSIQVEYGFEKNMDEAEDELKDIIADIELPEGANEPDVARLSLNAFPILALSIANDEQSLAELTTIVEDDILPALKGVDGVSSVQVSGQQLEEVQFTFNDEKMKEYGLDEETVQNLIKGADVNFPLGLYTLEETEKSVIVDGNIASIEDLKNLEIPVMPSSQGAGQGAIQGNQATDMTVQSAQGGQAAGQVPAAPTEIPTVKLSEIADIKLVGKAESISKTNGKEAIGIQIVKATDANTVEVAKEVVEELDKFEEDIKGLDVVYTLDQATPIEESVNTMLSKAAFGALFAVVIILIFLRDIKSTLISIISIPLSLLIAIILLNQMDITLNMMTLGAMTVAIGRVVDDSIVVIENIYRRMSLKGERLKGKALVREATKEMFMPIMSSTIVTIAVFLPLALVKGMIGELFLPFALTIVFALLASLLVAVTIVPMMAHSLFKKNLYGEGKKIKHDEHKPGKFTGAYRRILNWTLNHKIITSSIAIILLVGSLFLIPIIGVSFLSSEEEKMLMVTYKPEPGETRESAEEQTEKAESFFLDRENVKTVQYSLGSENPMNPGDTNSAVFFIEYEDDTQNFTEEKETVIQDLQETVKSGGEWASQDFASAGASNAITMYIYGDSVEEIEPVVEDVQEIMERHEDLKNVESSLAETYEEYTFVANQDELSKLGLTAAQIGMELSPTRERPVLTKVEKDGEELNVYLQVEEETYETVNDLTDQTIQSPLGKEVKIGDVVDVKEGETSDTVTRRDGKIYVQVSGEIKTDDVAKVSADVQAEVDDLDVPSSIDINMGGVTEDIQESFTQLGLAMLAAIAIVYFILVITFGGGLAPFAILFSLPFTVIGALVGLLIAGETLSINAMIGALMLIGIVVTNAIVLIDRVIHMEKAGLSTREAILEAGTTRLRPILMTAIATIGALIPLALGFEGSGMISKGLGVTVIGGLTSSTLLTLVIVPIVYEMLSKLRRKKTLVEEE
ncbi:efflux RND transporter permease subunit [Metabacillus sediminilitoris]|uniref:Efflux RND transporter permease subunit n=1 Tax=Metabacillus sediminilitoris TaxID=2567941 RepID=A0A4S4C1M9_9BACI|nr:efflux RND transporter permease subunit [Metabacillus sediminilitoris]QGQ48075.1 MMPL family transporter [Metabacillus sediminilitoris]THF81563.1 efflux RND transporter permease subunit [Metabacillus sediminilitoris]